MRAAGAALFCACLAAAPAAAQMGPGAPPVSPETSAALAQARSGDASRLRALADAGRIDAQMLYGVVLAFDDRRPADDVARGCALLEQASAQRADAMHYLGEAYEQGRCGGGKDLQRAAATFHKAGELGLAKSLCAEGNVLQKLGRDKAETVALCRRGAEAGDADAQTDLANFYLQGDLVPRDMAIARGWYEKAAAQGQANAALVLGQIYWNAGGVPRDTKRAAELWRLAYAHGRLEAAFYLGNEAFLRAGMGAQTWNPDTLAEARDWYAKAVDSKSPEIAKQARERRDLSVQLIDVMHRKGAKAKG